MDREQRDEASRRWVRAAAQTEEAQALVALGWQVVSPYGYSHPSGWTIERCSINGEWRTLLWKGQHIYDRFETPLAAAEHHAMSVQSPSSAIRTEPK
ncbi:hypothetical protein [Burkholderia gladioli]|uniref:hypothetical protein n=1 Tax=Burkholderia gladioli TaxID=28095 RepID=UPI001641BD0C|nr:hypothetical protein [Burkholderia gladioli]